MLNCADDSGVSSKFTLAVSLDVLVRACCEFPQAVSLVQPVV